MCLLGKCCGATDIDNPHLFVTDGRCFIQIVSDSSRSVFLMSSFRKKIDLLKTRLNETINLSSFTGCSASFCHQAFNAGASLDDDLQFLLGFLCSYGLPRACTRYQGGRRIAHWITFSLCTQQPWVRFSAFPKIIQCCRDFLTALLRTVDRGLNMSSNPFSFCQFKTQYLFSFYYIFVEHARQGLEPTISLCREATMCTKYCRPLQPQLLTMVPYLLGSGSSGRALGNRTKVPNNSLQDMDITFLSCE